MTKRVIVICLQYCFGSRLKPTRDGFKKMGGIFWIDNETYQRWAWLEFWDMYSDINKNMLVLSGARPKELWAHNL